jgi:hypothetical protein
LQPEVSARGSTTRRWLQRAGVVRRRRKQSSACSPLQSWPAVAQQAMRACADDAQPEQIVIDVEPSTAVKIRTDQHPRPTSPDSMLIFIIQKYKF